MKAPQQGLRRDMDENDYQCLLDIIDRIISDNWSRRDGKTIYMFLTTDEEKAAYAKLQKAGEFHVPPAK